MKETLSLAYIIGTYPSLTTTFIDREIRILRELGMEIQIITIRRPPPEMVLSQEQQALQESVLSLLPVSGAHLLLAHLYFTLLRPRRFFGILLRLLTRPHPSLKAWLKTWLHFGEGVYAAFLLRRSQPAHLHAHFVDRAATVARIAGCLLERPYSVTAHANDIYRDNLLLCEKLGRARFAVTVSEFNKSYLLEQCPGLNPAQIHVLHPWVDLGHFYPPAARADSSQAGALRILSVGRLVEKKGHAYLVEACHLLREKGLDFECRIIGDGPLESELETRIARYGLQDRVRLLGPQPQSAVLDNLVWCDVFALACVIAQDGDRDGMPVALAEAMAMQVPVVSCQIVGIDELVRPGAGLLVPPRDAPALAEALQTFYSQSRQARAEMGRRGRAIVEADFSLHKGVRQLGEFFQQSAHIASNKKKL
ncbi:MAG: glycosyltransferase [Chloroflexota bacterium]